jgi:hypothetical protein
MTNAGIPKSSASPARKKAEPLGQDVGEVVCIAETAKAVLVEWTDSDEQSWIPKSCLKEDDNEISCLGDRGVLVIPRWLAVKIGRCDQGGYTLKGAR